ncbi:uncharacterized protein LOC128212928 [Mya arenaria]|uniref:uncharacterized protein LOC128212928 n=1 Tax=Mya arenaria TaxID=6604 RepID=UPI0022E79F33|nr:uncharacterized protein LOC128212928 [Mya arenaria]
MKHEKYLRQQCLVDTSVSINTEHMFNEKHDANVQVNSSDFLHQDEDANTSNLSKKIVALKRNEMSLVKEHSKSKVPVISGIDFLEDGRLVAIDNANKKCLVLGEYLQVLGKPFTFFTTPLDICVYKENQAVVTSGNQLYFLSVDYLSTIGLIRKVSTSSQYFSVSRFNCSMFVCCTYEDDKAPVRVVDFEGKETDFKDILFPFINIGLGQSFSTYSNHLGILTLTHFDSNKVYMFNTHTGGIITVEDKRILSPGHVCMGPDDTVLFSCERNSSICRITLEGQVLQTLDVEKLNLTALCISQDETKLVASGSSTSAQTIQLYKLADTL